ncbi:hypothetical protein BT63DRAFT_459956 [Microthyrium microscopicum]|uniref:Uncharacterized protein n=1 Tax=Microthyrium microscopicum TaxID=703497 RepID=A0A6A6TZ62_9PEZI|nr:hypothetical protein BT63DRAFT_459956 [Microthyrium microscopicum]
MSKDLVSKDSPSNDLQSERDKIKQRWQSWIMKSLKHSSQMIEKKPDSQNAAAARRSLEAWRGLDSFIEVVNTTANPTPKISKWSTKNLPTKQHGFSAVESHELNSGQVEVPVVNIIRHATAEMPTRTAHLFNHALKKAAKPSVAEKRELFEKHEEGEGTELRVEALEKQSLIANGSQYQLGQQRPSERFKISTTTNLLEIRKPRAPRATEHNMAMWKRPVPQLMEQRFERLKERNKMRKEMRKALKATKNQPNTQEPIIPHLELFEQPRRMIIKKGLTHLVLRKHTLVENIEKRKTQFSISKGSPIKKGQDMPLEFHSQLSQPALPKNDTSFLDKTADLSWRQCSLGNMLHLGKDITMDSPSSSSAQNLDITQEIDTQDSNFKPLKPESIAFFNDPFYSKNFDLNWFPLDNSWNQQNTEDLVIGSFPPSSNAKAWVTEITVMPFVRIIEKHEAVVDSRFVDAASVLWPASHPKLKEHIFSALLQRKVPSGLGKPPVRKFPTSPTIQKQRRRPAKSPKPGLAMYEAPRLRISRTLSKFHTIRRHRTWPDTSSKPALTMYKVPKARISLHNTNKEEPSVYAESPSPRQAGSYLTKRLSDSKPSPSSGKFLSITRHTSVHSESKHTTIRQVNSLLSKYDPIHRPPIVSRKMPDRHLRRRRYQAAAKQHLQSYYKKARILFQHAYDKLLSDEAILTRSWSKRRKQEQDGSLSRKYFASTASPDPTVRLVVRGNGPSVSQMIRIKVRRERTAPRSKLSIQVRRFKSKTRGFRSLAKHQNPWQQNHSMLKYGFTPVLTSPVLNRVNSDLSPRGPPIRRHVVGMMRSRSREQAYRAARDKALKLSHKLRMVQYPTVRPDYRESSQQLQLAAAAHQAIKNPWMLRFLLSAGTLPKARPVRTKAGHRLAEWEDDLESLLREAPESEADVDWGARSEAIAQLGHLVKEPHTDVSAKRAQRTDDDDLDALLNAAKLERKKKPGSASFTQKQPRIISRDISQTVFAGLAVLEGTVSNSSTSLNQLKPTPSPDDLSKSRKVKEEELLKKMDSIFEGW